MSDKGMSGAAVSLRNISKRYGEDTVVADVSLDIAPGEFVTFLGPSGSGKTSTLNIIAGFTKASEGTVFVDGSDLGRTPPHRRNFGVVFQHYALFPHMSVAQNIAFPLRQRKCPRKDIPGRVADALDKVGLSGYQERLPRQLSGGQAQRVAVARALVFQPRVLLMDEPLGALDLKLREMLQLEIRRLHKELGITFIYITHDQTEALVLSERIAVFNSGRVEQLGSAKDLYSCPSSTFVARFIGEANLFEGEVSSDKAVFQTPLGPLLVSASHGYPTGTEGAVLVRPDRMQILPAGVDPAVNTNALAGRVEDVIFLGSAVKLAIRLDDGRPVTVRLPAETVPAATVGVPIMVVWAPHDSVFVPHEAGGPHDTTVSTTPPSRARAKTTAERRR